MKLNRILSTILSAIISITLLSGCEKSESVTEGTASSENTVSETTAKYSEEELELIEHDMPDIVFVMQHHYDDSNIRGLYITNK